MGINPLTATCAPSLQTDVTAGTNGARQSPIGHSAPMTPDTITFSGQVASSSTPSANLYHVALLDNVVGATRPASDGAVGSIRQTSAPVEPRSSAANSANPTSNVAARNAASGTSTSSQPVGTGPNGTYRVIGHVTAHDHADAAPSSTEQNPPEQHWYDRPLGALQAAGGVGEMAVGGALLAAPEPTGLTKVAGAIVGLHGVDDVQAGLRTAITGHPAQTATQQVVTGAAKALGAQPGPAVALGSIVDGGLGMANPEGEAGKLVRGAVEVSDAEHAARSVAKLEPGTTSASNAAKAPATAATSADPADHTSAAGRVTKNSLVNEIVQTGVRVAPSDVVAAAKLPSGNIVFLERGDAKSGLQHIVAEHGREFAQEGVAEDQIPEFLMDALKNGKVVGQQGKSGTRPIYEVQHEGRTVHVAITTGSNGYLVGANIQNLTLRGPNTP